MQSNIDLSRSRSTKGLGQVDRRYLEAELLRLDHLSRVPLPHHQFNPEIPSNCRVSLCEALHHLRFAPL